MALGNERVQKQTQQFVLDVRLSDGEGIQSYAGDDEKSAQAELSSIHASLSSETFVLVGQRTIVRSQDVRYVQLHDEEASGQGLLETLKSRVGGGDKMTSYEPEQIQQTAVARGEPGYGPGVRSQGTGPGFAERYGPGYGRRPWSETKPFFMTSEFLTLLGTIAAIAIAMAVSDVLDADRGWLFITIAAVGYMVSRGLAKSGTRDPNPSEGPRV